MERKQRQRTQCGRQHDSKSKCRSLATCTKYVSVILYHEAVFPTFVSHDPKTRTWFNAKYLIHFSTLQMLQNFMKIQLSPLPSWPSTERDESCFQSPALRILMIPPTLQKTWLTLLEKRQNMLIQRGHSQATDVRS